MKKILLAIVLLSGATSINARQRLQDRNTAPLENDSNTVDLAEETQLLIELSRQLEEEAQQLENQEETLHRLGFPSMEEFMGQLATQQ